MNNANLHTTGTTTARNTGATSATIPTTNTGPGVGSTTTAPTGMGNAGVAGDSVPATRQTTNPVKAGFAAVHGLGETVRGAFNSAVDGAFNESGGVTKNNAVTSAGIDEMETGKFSHATKNGEGVVPGSNGERRGL